jgi:ppGpp synthetase/RelA/SpoT-type nucleotidyltranferase
MTTKATLYLDSKMYKTLKLRAVETNQTISGLMNEALQAQLAEDLDDINSIHSRLAKKGKPLSYEAALKELQDSGVL